jgi:hypothetical protein
MEIQKIGFSRSEEVTGNGKNDFVVCHIKLIFLFPNFSLSLSTFTPLSFILHE